MKLSKLCCSLWVFFFVLCASNFAVGLEPAHSRQFQAVVEGEALVTVAGESRGVLVFGVEADYVSVLKALSSDATLDEFELGEGAFVSAGLSLQFSINPGDLITLVNPTGQSTPMGRAPRVISYRVLGVVDSTLFAAAGEAVYIRRIDAEKFSTPNK